MNMFVRRPGEQQAIRRSSRDPLVIGLVNNMPDSALRGTERQFCALLSAASRDFVVRLKVFSLSQIDRSESARAHIAKYYDNIRELEDEPPDGLIVTGTQPRAPDLRDEPYWPALSRLVAFAQEFAVPSVWSCLAAHAAVLHLDGIGRRPLGPKLSGIFDCQIGSDRNELVCGTPAKWRVPHSRFFGLPIESLLSGGYEILSWSPHVGADIFMKHSDAPTLFFQGHPEYDSSSILAEYRRDVSRFLLGEQEQFPDMPRGYFGARVEGELAAFRNRVLCDRNPDLMKEFAGITLGSGLEAPWFTTAVRIYANWLSLLSDRRSQRPGPSTHSVLAPNVLARLA